MIDQQRNSQADWPRIVAIETSGRTGSVAVALGPQILDERIFSGSQRHAIELMPTIRELIAAQGWQPRQIQQVYLSIGPGSFTGLRIAVMVARSLAQAIGCLVVAVPTLDVLAMNGPPEVQNLAVILDAKRGQVYAARYHRDNPVSGASQSGRKWLHTTGPILTTPQEFVRQSPKPLHILGEGIDYHRPALDAMDEISGAVTELGRQYWMPHAVAVHVLGWSMAQRGEFANTQSLIPVYIRLPEAQELWNSRHGGVKDNITNAIRKPS